MTLVLVGTDSFPDRWRRALRATLGDRYRLQELPELDDPEAARVAVAWNPPPGWWRGLPNLAAIVSPGAGVHHLLRDPDLPDRLPIVRTVDASLVEQMGHYVLWAVLDFHRQGDRYRQQQRQRQWQLLPARRAADCPAGLLGLGRLGLAAGRQLAAAGFPVLGWSRSPKDPAQLGAIAGFHGPEGLAALLPQCQSLVCLLPLTPATAGLLNRDLFDRLPRGAAIVNAARGGHLVEADLLDALTDGRVGAAYLDVFATEPLPPGHPFWTHPAVTVTPHAAALTPPEAIAARVEAVLAALETGAPLPEPVDRSRGY